MSTTTRPAIPAYWNPKTGEVCPPHIAGTDAAGDTLYVIDIDLGWYPVTDYWIDEDGFAHAEDSPHNRTFRAAVVGEVALTTEAQAHLPADELLDAAMASAREARIEITRDIRITTWTK